MKNFRIIIIVLAIALGVAGCSCGSSGEGGKIINSSDVLSQPGGTTSDKILPSGVSPSEPVVPEPAAVDTASDGIKNGDETDIDCGGSNTPPCTTGQGCLSDDDCASGNSCVSGICTLPPPGPVATGGACTENADCAGHCCSSGTCVENSWDKAQWDCSHWGN